MEAKQLFSQTAELIFGGQTQTKNINQTLLPCTLINYNYSKSSLM